MSDSGQPPRRRRRRNSAMDNESNHPERSTQPQHQGQLTRTERQEIVDLLRQESADKFLQRAIEIGLNPATDFAELNLSGVNLSPASLQGSDLTGVNLSQANLSNAHLNHAKLTNANLQQANLQRSNPSFVDLSGANLKEANLSNADLNHANLSQTNLQQADLSNANLNDANLNNANLEEANLENAKLAAIKLQGAKCDRANFQGVRFYYQFKDLPHQTDNLSQISFKGANFANTSLAGINVSNSDLSHANLNHANLSDANLTHANLEGANLEKANLAKTKLRGAKCDRANFQEVRFYYENQYNAWDLSQISFQGANFANTYLSKLNFSHSDLSHANFQQAQLTQIDLTNANLKGANFQGVTFNRVTLKGAIIDEQTQMAASWRKVIAVVNKTNEDLELQNLDLSHQDFSGFNLAGANLSNADLTSANLENANLKGANLTGVDLSEANLLGTQIDETTNLDPMWRRAWAVVNSSLDAESSNYAIRGVMPAILERYRDRIEATIKPYLGIHLVPDDTLTWWSSKFPGEQISRAGLPYLPKGMSYPQTPEGEYLHLLAQINFAEAPFVEPFPQQGILQFFIANCDYYGCPYPYQQPWKEFQANWCQQTTFRIRYFPEPDLNEANLETNFDFLPDKNESPDSFNFIFLDAYPSTCSAIQWSSGKDFMPSEDYQFHDVMFHDLDWSDFVEEEEFIEEFTEAYDTYNWYKAYCREAGVEETTTDKTQDSTSYTDRFAQIGGYTLFPQEDLRQSSTGCEGLDGPLDTILLKISLPGEDIWFYIQQSDLIQRDFSRVFYALESTV